MDSLLQHFRKDEQPFIEQAAGWLREVEDRYTPKLTDFLDPRERFIVRSVVGASGIMTASEGLFPDAERQRMLLYPEYLEPVKEDFNITVFTVNYPSKFVTLAHPDVLGSLMGLGLGRGKFGDIRVDGDVIQVAIADEISQYVRTNFVTAGKVKVSLEAVEGEEQLLVQTEEWLEETLTVSSMRLDTVLASIFNISRQKASALINGGRVKVNWTVTEQPSFELHESDLLSVRGLGRVRVIMIEGRTKKDKLRLVIGRLEQKK
ncbi:YlmH family RNA-binding protein [Planococcus lenghuensis]|uniref:RNA-binding protein n=1 Tax=Planococcus lenghuensis TaxID=2213202 RepID=A0A1Q2L010_9BACL|nr:YlmH/Sll1252 family protein [Planococcus lenghuensis]AQQ53790.1 RNA-binding protein [Planococcus lenghuensis]